MTGFIAVHVGAGSHSESLSPQYKKACKEACNAALTLLGKGCCSAEAVAAAVSVLEDCPLTNAGTGSNLSLKKTVECDAGIMEGAHLNFASVGSLSNIKNPVLVAKKILDAQEKGLSCGRVPPSMLVGPGALDWALKNGFSFTEQADMITRSTERQHTKNLSLVMQKASNDFRNNLLDTVGAVCVDSNGTVSSAVSSGGLMLKIPGRIGQAAIFGAGCWAQNSTEPDKPDIACSVSGVGEYLVKTLFARECHWTVYNQCDSIFSLQDALKERFIESPYLRNVPFRLAGVLLLKHYASNGQCELMWAHNTKTMILGYGTVGKQKTVAMVSQQSPGVDIGTSISGGEKCFRLVSR